MTAATRLLSAAFVGPPPEGQEVRHLNGDRSDCRLANLKYGTRAENMQDSVLHGTNSNTRKVHCKRGHLFDAKNTRVSESGSRTCRTCARENERRRREANRDAS